MMFADVQKLCLSIVKSYVCQLFKVGFDDCHSICMYVYLYVHDCYVYFTIFMYVHVFLLMFSTKNVTIHVPQPGLPFGFSLLVLNNTARMGPPASDACPTPWPNGQHNIVVNAWHGV
jgi:hypothetical protein